MLKLIQPSRSVMWWWRRSDWRLRAACLLALAALLALRVPATSELAAQLAAPPHKLAAHLADFNNLRLLYPHIASWKLESQWTNYTSWVYAVSFSCGARCAGGAAVRAHDVYGGGAGAGAGGGDPAHGAAAAHHGTFILSTCSSLPLLPWPTFCEELEVEWFVEAGAEGGAGGGAGAGARYAERARLRRALAAAALGRLRGGSLSAARAAHLRALRAAFP